MTGLKVSNIKYIYDTFKIKKENRPNGRGKRQYICYNCFYKYIYLNSHLKILGGQIMFGFWILVPTVAVFIYIAYFI